jgi:hypothetical protein
MRKHFRFHHFPPKLTCCFVIGEIDGCIARTKLASAGAPFREHFECRRERYIDRMHTLGRQDVQRPRHWRRHRGHQHCKRPVVEFFDDQRRNQGLFDFDERRRKCRFVPPPGETSCQATQQRVTGKPFENGPPKAFFARNPGPVRTINPAIKQTMMITRAAMTSRN